jgi:hypothetical protein
MIRSNIRVSTTIAAFLISSSCAASADVAPSPAPAATAVSAADPCGDTNLLATTDRPTFGTNPCVVKPATAIVEFGYRNTVTSGEDSARRSSVPQNRDRVGLFPHVELVLDPPSVLTASGNGASITGSSNFGAGLKYEFGYFGNFVHGIAGEVVLPTGGPPFSSGLPSFNGSYQIGGGIVKNVGFNLTLGFNTFSSPNPGGGKNVQSTAFAPTFILGALVAPQTKLNVEVANSSSNGLGTSGQYYGNIFLQHQFTEYFLLDVEAAQRFTIVDGRHEHYVGVGGSIRL